ncbi:protein-export chaperone SecB [Lentibacillus sediminis]|uniref:protein-export chaperone SecB n=1 Tax=Lentibacillus sediminis TaxID=1940529 RepID=UPI000C1C751B|nr:protein-export chaperone SecB [Lentibacillus sediminis]
MVQENEFEYYKFIKMKFQMTEARLEDIHIERFQEIPEDQCTNQVNFGRRYEYIDERTYKGFLKTIIQCKNRETEEVVMNIEVVYSGEFQTTELDPAQMEEYVDAQIVPQLLPYSRSVIAHLTSLMDIPPVHIPTMDVIQSLSANNHKSDNGDA